MSFEDAETRAEFESWLADLGRNADAIERLQDALAGSLEFQSLMIAYKAAPRDKSDDYMRNVANFAVLFMAQKR